MEEVPKYLLQDQTKAADSDHNVNSDLHHHIYMQEGMWTLKKIKYIKT